MPPILERLVGQLEAKGKSKSSAFAIATSQLQKHGLMKHGSQELTSKGAERQAMGAAGRAKDRAAQGSSHTAKDYNYNPRTNRATLKHYAGGGGVRPTRHWVGTDIGTGISYHAIGDPDTTWKVHNWEQQQSQEDLDRTSPAWWLGERMHSRGGKVRAIDTSPRYAGGGDTSRDQDMVDYARRVAEHAEFSGRGFRRPFTESYADPQFLPRPPVQEMDAPTFQSGGVPQGVPTKGYDTARRALKLTPQEELAYRYHLHNLWTADGYDHPDGGRSTYYMTPYEENGQWYALPGVAGGRLLDVDEAVAQSKAAGLHNFPTYGSREELEKRYSDLHPYFEDDTREWNDVRRGPLDLGGGVTTHRFGGVAPPTDEEIETNPEYIEEVPPSEEDTEPDEENDPDVGIELRAPPGSIPIEHKASDLLSEYRKTLPRSKTQRFQSGGEVQLARRGDRETMNGIEHESIGVMRPEGGWEDDIEPSDEEWSQWRIGKPPKPFGMEKGKGMEFWRPVPKPKREVPTS